jgi:hypothetical protein
MKKVFLTLSLAAFIGGIALNSFAQEGEKKSQTTKTTKKSSKCDKKSCCKKDAPKKTTKTAEAKAETK